MMRMRITKEMTHDLQTKTGIMIQTHDMGDKMTQIGLGLITK